MKSHEQDLLTVCRCILLDAAAKCATEKASVLRDFETIRSRTEHEGISFFMITLPSFGQEFERCLDQKEVTSSSFVGWQKNQCLPSFLRGFTKLVFDAGTGGLHVHPDIAAIEGIRQIAYSFKKLLLPCSPKREKETLSGYIEVEQFLKASMYPRDADLFLKISDLLWGSVFANFQISECIPKHGPGQTAEGINGNRKYLQRVWYERLEPFFPICDYLLVNYNQLESSDFGLDSFSVVQEEQETPVKVSFVPKTFKGPRIIAMEPVCFQYAQQGISRVLVNTLESHWLTSGHINFTDQSINQRLAITASHDGLSATLDLSSASDRVPATLVGQMLNVYPDLRDAIFACRSKAAQIPGGEVIALSKFASMGSALCWKNSNFLFLLETCIKFLGGCTSMVMILSFL